MTQVSYHVRSWQVKHAEHAERYTFLEQKGGLLWRDAPVHYTAHYTFIAHPHYTSGREDEVQPNRSRKKR